MSAADALFLVQSAMWVALVASAPVIVSVMAVGLVVSVFQALTQVQEMTLTFVPKMIVAIVALALTAPFIGNKISGFADQTYKMIERGGSTVAAKRMTKDSKP
jgi:flagellar biosynthetic protein FliQ